VDCGGQSRCRACLNGSDDLTDCAQPVTYSIPSPRKHPLALSLETGIHHPRWRFPALLTNKAQVSTAIHTAAFVAGTLLYLASFRQTVALSRNEV